MRRGCQASSLPQGTAERERLLGRTGETERRGAARVPRGSAGVGAVGSMVAVQAEWTPSLSGGCPKHKTWHANPMFQLVPGPAVVDASYSLTLRQLGGTAHAIGLFIIPADNMTDRKTRLAKGDIIARTKFTKGATSRLDVSLPRRDAGLPYIVVASTFDPG